MHGEANTFSRAVPELSSPVQDGPTIPASGSDGERQQQTSHAHADPRKLSKRSSFTGAKQTGPPIAQQLGKLIGQELNEHPEEEQHCANLHLNCSS